MSNAINPNVASHIAYLINSMQCSEIKMQGECKYVTYGELRAKWALALIRLADYGIELPNLDMAKAVWDAAREYEQGHATATVRDLAFHTEQEAK